MPDSELNALITLLDDSDDEVYTHVADKLMSFGHTVIPTLETVWEESFDPVLQQRIEGLIHRIQFEEVIDDLKRWLDDGGEDLQEGALILTRYQYPDIDENQLKNDIVKIRKDIWLEFNYGLTPLEQTYVFNQVFYGLHGFSGNTTSIQDPRNCYLNNVLESKKGNTLSVGILYLILAQQLGLPIFGVALPNHFILVRTDEAFDETEPKEEDQERVVFYINPFNKGMVFTKKEIHLYLKRLKLDPRPEYFLPSTNIRVMMEIIRHLKNLYEHAGSAEKADEMGMILDVFSRRGHS